MTTEYYWKTWKATSYFDETKISLEEFSKIEEFPEMLTYLHREDGPAYIDMIGQKWWFKNGKQHREDGPAYESGNGLYHYALEDKELSLHEWLMQSPYFKSDEERVAYKLALNI